MHEFEAARQAIEQMIRGNDLEGLLRHGETLHGHRCPYLALGVKAGRYALTLLEREGKGLTEMVAMVEAKNCFADGIQVVTGCTFGNGGLIFQDLGKTAVTVARREDGRAVRLLVRPDFRERLFFKYPAAGPLFETVVLKGAGTEEDRHRFQHLWAAVAKRELETPMEEQFLIRELTFKAPAAARPASGVVCSRCGEGVTESRILVREGQPLCLVCAGESFPMVAGGGVSYVPGS
jgi:formylmethanofuran dehydrogenase subunit E